MGLKTDLANATATVNADIAAFKAADVVDAATAQGALDALNAADGVIKTATPPPAPPAQ